MIGIPGAWPALAGDSTNPSAINDLRPRSILGAIPEMGSPGDRPPSLLAPLGTHATDFREPSDESMSYSGSIPGPNATYAGLTLAPPESQPSNDLLHAANGGPCDRGLVECAMANRGNARIMGLCAQSYRSCLTTPHLWILFPGFAIPPRIR